MSTAKKPAVIMPERIVMRPTASLVKYARNSRTHDQRQVEVLAKSIQDFGFTNPVLIDGDRGVIAGHGRIMAAELLGLPEVPCIELRHLTDDQKRALVIWDNRSFELSEWNEPLLAQELADLSGVGFEATDLGFDAAEVDRLMETLGVDFGAKAEGDPDSVPEAPVVATSKLGDVWLLGRHRVMCGDSTDRAQVERLMHGKKADMVFTDPPYNIASENKGIAANVSKSHSKLMASEWDMAFDFARVQESILESLSVDATVYVCTSHHLAGDIWAWMKTWASHLNWCVWSKPNPMPSLMKRHWTWNAELICYGTRGKHTFNFPELGHALSVWTIGKVNGASGHPTEKPVAVPEHAILHSSATDATVLDLFGGSGSTLIACEKTGREARLMELDPAYVDVIVRRWQDFTGKTATLERYGRTFAEMTEVRRAAH